MNQTSLLVETRDPNENISPTMRFDELQCWKFVGHLQLEGMRFGKGEAGKPSLLNKVLPYYAVIL